LETHHNNKHKDFAAPSCQLKRGKAKDSMGLPLSLPGLESCHQPTGGTCGGAVPFTAAPHLHPLPVGCPSPWAQCLLCPCWAALSQALSALKQAASVKHPCQHWAQWSQPSGCPPTLLPPIHSPTTPPPRSSWPADDGNISDSQDNFTSSLHSHGTFLCTFRPLASSGDKA